MVQRQLDGDCRAERVAVDEYVGRLEAAAAQVIPGAFGVLVHRLLRPQRAFSLAVAAVIEHQDRVSELTQRRYSAYAGAYVAAVPMQVVQYLLLLPGPGPPPVSHYAAYPSAQ